MVLPYFGIDGNNRGIENGTFSGIKNLKFLSLPSKSIQDYVSSGDKSYERWGLPSGCTIVFKDGTITVKDHVPETEPEPEI